jgi:hypothetical protein
MSISHPGRAIRSFIIGIRLWPPLRIFASSPWSWSRETASGIVAGLRYSNTGGIIVALAVYMLPDRFSQRFR